MDASLRGAEVSNRGIMELDLRFTDKQITAWRGMGLMKRLLDQPGIRSCFDCLRTASTWQKSLGAPIVVVLIAKTESRNSNTILPPTALT